MCKDALKSTLSKLAEAKNHSLNILYKLGWEMASRGLASDDKILFPQAQENYDAMLKIFENDLNQDRSQQDALTGYPQR